VSDTYEDLTPHVRSCGSGKHRWVELRTYTSLNGYLTGWVVCDKCHFMSCPAIGFKGEAVRRYKRVQRPRKGKTDG
jgi:hypothetical protein